MKHILKSISLFMAVVLLFVSVPSELFLSAETVITAYIEATDVRVRETPSTANNDNIIEKISNTSAAVLEEKKISSSEIWYKITYTNSSGKKITGYIKYDPEYIRIVEYNPDASFEEKLKAFPESYRDALRSLHAAYPNWEFIPDPIKTPFSEAVADQLVNMRKQVQVGSSAHPISWRSMGLGSYDWTEGKWVTTNGGWTGASREVVAYYMDPRNFLNIKEIYMFLEQSYNSKVQNEAGVKKIIKGTFLEKAYTPAKDETGSGSYLKVIMAAAKESGVSPYIIASKIIQEQGTKGNSSLISGTYDGYEGYYNFFNVNASGPTTDAVIKNGLKYAKDKGWNTRYKSILGGAKFLGKDYIAVNQETYYYQDFNVKNDKSKLWHQYAQAVHDAYSKGKNLADTYASEFDMALSFKIPVFTDMPSKASAQPVKNSKRNNYYFSTISVSGLTPSFDKYTYEYNLAVTGDTAVKAKAVSGATNTSKSEYTLKKGTNTVTLTVKSETGYTMNYKISVKASKACKLYVNSSGKLPNGTVSEPEKEPEVMIGDTNSDGRITILDLAKIQMHLLKVKTLYGDNLTAADINKDGKVTIVDLARVQMHLLKVKTIKQ